LGFEELLVLGPHRFLSCFVYAGPVGRDDSEHFVVGASVGGPDPASKTRRMGATGDDAVCRCLCAQ
jgi:hypothetical protein